MSESDVSEKITGCLIQIKGRYDGPRYNMFGSEMFIGRNLNASIRLDHPSVSRTHCVFKYIPNVGWSVRDNKSQNGTYLNGISVDTEFHPVHDKGVIHLGNPSAADPEGLAFRFENFTLQTRVKVGKIASNSDVTPAQICNPTKDENSNLNTVSCKRKLQDRENENLLDRILKDNHSSQGSSEVTNCSCPSSGSVVMKSDNVSPDKNERRNQKKSKLSAEKLLLFCQRLQTEIRNTNIKEEADDSESLIPVEDYFQMEPDPFSEAFDDSAGNLTSNSKNLNQCVENTPGIQKSKHIDSSEIDSLHVKLKSLEAQIKTLEASKEQLEKEVNAKNELLQIQLDKEEEAKKNMETHIAKIEQDMLDQIKSKLEEEMSCNICTELLVKATVLGCSHTFCEHCIMQWKKRRNQCPVCRNKIATQTKVLIIDNIIDKALDQLSPEIAEKRKELIVSREKTTKKKPVAKPKIVRRRRRWGIDLDIPHTAIDDYIPVNAIVASVQESLNHLEDVHHVEGVHHVEELEDLEDLETVHQLEELEDFEDSSDSSSVEGYNGFYPGYGRCFNCGRRGHWANGCPHY